MKKLNAQNGFTLLEVLVTLVILAVGLLGLAGLQATSIHQNHSAYLRSQATLLAYDMIDRMRANKGAAATYVATAPASASKQSACTSSGCGPTAMAQNDLYEWNLQLVDTLPSGTAVISKAGDTYTVNVRWDDNQDGNVDGNDPDFRVNFQL